MPRARTVGVCRRSADDVKVEALTGATHRERSPDRVNHRNGYRDRPWETRAGRIDLRITKLRQGPTSQASWIRIRIATTQRQHLGCLAARPQQE